MYSSNLNAYVIRNPQHRTKSWVDWCLKFNIDPDAPLKVYRVADGDVWFKQDLLSS